MNHVDSGPWKGMKLSHTGLNHLPKEGHQTVRGGEDRRGKGIQAMAPGKDKQLIYQKIREYLRTLERSNVPVWRLYLYGSYAKDTYHAESDIDLAVFWDRDDIDGFDGDVLLRKLSCDVDLRIEPHSFARTDFDETDPYIKEIIETGERIL